MAKFNFAKKYNRERIFPIDTNGFEYYSLSDLAEEFPEEQIYVVRGIYINSKSQFGAAPVIALDDRYVNFPQHTMSVVEDILNDNNAIAAINEGHVGFTLYKYNSHNRVCYGVTWVDIP